MALISCPECGKEISDQSDVCIHCGYPIKNKAHNKNRIFPIGTVIGYECKQCGIPDAMFKVLTSSILKTEACCTTCNDVILIDFNNIVLTEDEYDSIYDDIYEGDVDIAAKKIVGMINCDFQKAKEYAAFSKAQIDEMEKGCNLVHIENRREKLAEIKEIQEQNRLVQDYKYSKNAECPYCHSKNTKKISGLSKAGSVALWGVFAIGKVSKQWYCNDCKSDF